MSRIPLIIAFLICFLPSIGMAGVMINGPQFNGDSVSAVSDVDEFPVPDCPQQLKTAGNLFEMFSPSVTTISHTPNALDSSPFLLAKAIPPLESIHGFDEWLFIPDSPHLKISKVPIGLNDLA